MDPLVKVPVPSKSPNNSILELVLLVVVIAIGFWFLVKPQQAQLTAKKATYESLTKQRDAVNTDRQKLNNLIEEFNENQSKIAKLDAALPLNSKVTLVYIMFQNIAQRSGVTIDSLAVNGKNGEVVAGNKDLIANPFKPQRSLGKMTVSMSITGSYPAFENFLKQLESNGRIVNVSSVEVSSESEGGLGFQLTMETYFYE